MRHRATGRRSGAEVEGLAYQLWGFRDGRVVYFTMCPTLEDAEAAGRRFLG
jgi:hypothetical protein